MSSKFTAPQHPVSTGGVDAHFSHGSSGVPPQKGSTLSGNYRQAAQKDYHLSLLNKENKNGMLGNTIELNRTANQDTHGKSANVVPMNANSRSAASAKQQMHMLHMQQ